MAFFKRGEKIKGENLSNDPYEILMKYDDDPFFNAVIPNYEQFRASSLQGRSIAASLRSDRHFLEETLNVNKGKKNPEFRAELEKTLYLRSLDLSTAKTDKELLEKGIADIKTIIKKTTSKIEKIEKKKGNTEAEQAYLKKYEEALESSEAKLSKAQDKFNIAKNSHDEIESFINFIDHMEKHSLDKPTIERFEKAIKELNKLSKKFQNLFEEGSNLYRKYGEFWGKNKDEIEEMKTDPHKFSEKEIIHFEKLVDELKQLSQKIPRQNEVLDEFLDSQSPEPSLKIT